MNKGNSKTKDKKQSDNPTYIESVANEILAKYRRLDSVLSHAPTKGSYHEKIIREVIRNYLPSTFSTGEGFIINKDGQTSPQMDVLIVDNLDPRSFGYKDNDFYIASDIAVTSFGEVKTYCTKKEFLDAFSSLIESSLIMGGDNSSRSTSFLFCYDAYASEGTFSKWLDLATAQVPKNGSVKLWNFPDYIFCLKKKIMYERRQVPGGIQYFNLTSSNARSNIVQLKIVEGLIQCITNGCGRIRLMQGIKPLAH